MKLWDIRDRRNFIDKYEAREYLHMMRVVNAGFNGGESAVALQKDLHQKAFPVMLTLADKKRKPRNWMRAMIESATIQKEIQ